MTDYRVPTGANEEQPERHTEQLCGRCKNIGQVLVAPIRWNQQRHLIWRCEKCGHAWTTLERRLNDAITGVASVIGSAWTRAGKPPVPSEEVRTPRKVRRQ